MECRKRGPQPKVTGRPVREHADDEEDEALLDLAEEAAARAAAWLAGLDGGGADDLVL